jgi:hypothetical protein
MARRKLSPKPPAKRHITASQVILYAISVIVIVGIAAGFVISLLPTPVENRLLTPTPIQLETFTPTPTLTLTPTLTITTTTTPAGPPVEGVATPRSDQRPTVAP